MISARNVSSAVRIASGLFALAATTFTASAQTIHQGSVITSTVVRQPAYYVPRSVREDVSSPYVDLKFAIEKGRKSLIASRLPNPQAAKKRLVAEMETFEKYLGGAQSTNAKDWFKFLMWKELLVEVAKTEPNLRTLTDVELRYQQNILGLEYAPFQEMRRAIAEYIDAQRFGSNPEGTIKALDEQLTRLLKTIDSKSEATELERSREIGQLADYLISSNQAPELLTAFRSAYSQPNIRLMVGEGFVNRAVARPVNDSRPVDEDVLGTRVLGTSFINGTVTANLLPQRNGVGIELMLSGGFSSNNIGYNRGVKVYTTGQSPVYASKRITITPEGTITQPAIASTNLQSTIHGIEHRLRIVRRIASRKASEQQPEANAIGQGRLQSRLAQQFNDQIERQIAQGGSGGGVGGGGLNGLGALKQERIELRRLGIPKPAWELKSSDTHIVANVKEAAAMQLAAPYILPPTQSQNDIVAEVHQSLPMNLAESVLGGRTLHSWEMDDFVRQYTSNVPAELVKESLGEPWALTFATQHPVEVEFTDGLAIVTLRIAKMANKDQTLDQPATVTAKYKPVLNGGYLTLERDGEIDLKFVRAASGIRAVALRSFFKGKFDKLFREKTQPQRVAFPTQIPNISQLAVSKVTFMKGWAQFTLQ